MVSVLLATAGRPDMAERCVQSLLDSTESYRAEGNLLEIICAIDGDEETLRRLSALKPDLCVSLRLDYQADLRGSSRAWNDALALSRGEVVVLAADDLEFQPGWLEAALETLTEFSDGWGFVGFNDGHWGSELSTHYLMSRRFVIEVLGGVIAWEAYRHSFNDREANARAQAAGRYAWCENARVYHRHWIFGDRPQDSTDTRLLGEHGDSQRAFDERQAAGFPDEQEAVIT